MNSSVIVTIANVAARVRRAIQPIGTLTDRDPHADQRQQVERPVAGADADVREHDRDRVCADAEEGGVAEREVAGVAAEEVPGGRETRRTSA